MTDEVKLAIELARYEIEHRRKKQWDIFSWAVTIYIAVIAGVIVLTSKGELQLSDLPRWAMSFALSALTFYAVAWLHINLKAEEETIKQLIVLLPEAPIIAPSTFRLGYVFIALAIGGAATTIVFFAYLIPVVKAVGH